MSKRQWRNWGLAFAGSLAWFVAIVLAAALSIPYWIKPALNAVLPPDVDDIQVNIESVGPSRTVLGDIAVRGKDFELTAPRLTLSYRWNRLALGQLDGVHLFDPVVRLRKKDS